MSPEYDAIIVGARVAGASTAMLLARKGYRVLLVDRASFPSDIPQGHFIHKDGPRRLKDWGILNQLIAAGTPPVDRLSTYYGDFSLEGKDLVVDGIAWGYGPRRRILDEALVEAAVLAGAEFRESFSVEDLIREDERVVGIRGRSSATQVSQRGQIVIGADGRNSLTARLVGAPSYDETPPLLCYYFSYWSGLDLKGFELYHANQHVCFAHPTNDGLSAVFVAWPMELFPMVRSDIEGQFHAAVHSFPGLGERLLAGRREERFYGASDLRTFYRKPHGQGWALVGDAGYHKDPYLALGVADALRSADLLADAVDQGLSGHQPLNEALQSYELRRNEASRLDHRENLTLAQLGPRPPEMMSLRRALRYDGEETKRFYQARFGMIPPEQFFNPENLSRLMSAESTTA